MKIPTKNGHLLIEETSGRCVCATEEMPVNQNPGGAVEVKIKQCGLKGGGLVRVREVVTMGEALPRWDGRAVVVCGDHFLDLFGVAIKEVR